MGVVIPLSEKLVAEKDAEIRRLKAGSTAAASNSECLLREREEALHQHEVGLASATEEVRHLQGRVREYEAERTGLLHRVQEGESLCRKLQHEVQVLGDNVESRDNEHKDTEESLRAQ